MSSQAVTDENTTGGTCHDYDQQNTQILFQESHQKYMCVSFTYAIFSDAFSSSDHTVLNSVMISEERW
jgi:hypothetical protein